MSSFFQTCSCDRGRAANSNLRAHTNRARVPFQKNGGKSELPGRGTPLASLRASARNPLGPYITRMLYILQIFTI